MTPRQFQIEFERAASYIDKLKDDSIRINSSDINYFLNEALHVYITSRFKQIEVNGLIKRTQQNLDEIKELIVKSQVLIKDTGLSNNTHDVYTLPTNYYLLINDKSTTVFCNVEKTYQNRMYLTERINEVLEDTHHTTKYNSPVSELISNKLYIYKTTAFTINNVTIDYLKRWDEIDVINDTNTNLNVSVHKDILNLAITIFLENVNNSRFQSNVQKNVLTKQIQN